MSLLPARRMRLAAWLAAARNKASRGASLPFITFEHAWREYRRSERRLPQKPPAVRPERVAGIGAIREHFDAVILDAWCVLNLGATPIPRALAALKALR